MFAKGLGLPCHDKLVCGIRYSECRENICHCKDGFAAANGECDTKNGSLRHQVSKRKCLTSTFIQTFNWGQTMPYSVRSRVWKPSSPLSCNFANIRDDFDANGQLDSIAPKASKSLALPLAKTVGVEIITNVCKVA